MCKAHPRYKGVKQPMTACHGCWVLYFGLSEQCVNCGCNETYQDAVDNLVGKITK